VHLAALVESTEHVCCRYRLAAYRPFFEQAGHSLELQPRPRGWWLRRTIGRDVHKFDAVILQRRLLPLWQLQALRRQAKLLLFDFDDAIFVRDSYATKGTDSAGRLQRFVAVAQAADMLIAGNSFLAEHGARHAGGQRLAVIPTCVDPARYPLARHERGGRGAQLVWIGSSSTLRGLERKRSLLDMIGQACGVSLKIICDRFLRLRHLPVQACRWSETCEAGELAAADIGISWLPDDSWSRGKCALKVLQYMAAGLPVVANPVGVQAGLVRHGETGFLAETPDEWIEAIGTLARDPGLRRQMGLAGRQRIEDEFSVRQGAAKLVALLERLWAMKIEPAGNGTARPQARGAAR
jgi:hypothetical protein